MRPPPDALSEFSLQTSNFSAEYGQNSSGVVNVVTKSGTNVFHGNLFEFVRNAEFNARNFFAAKRDQLKRNQFGGSTGGLRGMKAQGFEGGIRVPLIARRPGVIPAGHTSDQPAAIFICSGSSSTSPTFSLNPP